MSSMIEILLATYNGAGFLAAQLDSLLAQTVDNIHILARDDGSTDATATILAEYAAQHSDRLTVLPTTSSSGSAAENFAILLAAATADYLMFADQDDIWRLEKVSQTLAAMQAAEQAAAPDTPLLIHTDLAVVDAQLHPICSSLWAYQKLAPDHADSLAGLLVQNVVTGCTVMLNRALWERAKPIPPDAIMHDWWLALVASAFGKVIALPQPTVQYRQHAANAVGAKGWNASYVADKANHFSEIKGAILRTERQAEAFHARYAESLTPAQTELVHAYATLDQQSFIEKRRRLQHYGFAKVGFIRNLALYLRV